MSRLCKCGLLLFFGSVFVFAGAASGICGPSTETGTVLAEGAIYSAPIGLVMLLFAFVREAARRWKVNGPHD
jgi:hypothetical protein